MSTGLNKQGLSSWHARNFHSIMTIQVIISTEELKIYKQIK